MKRTRTAVKETAPKEEPRPDSLRERVYQYLKDAMSAGKLRYGEFLDQDGICETLEVSKTPLRDALIRLEAEGLVVIRPRKGVYVPPVSDAYVKSACALAGSLESGCLDTVFERITPRLLRHMEDALRRQSFFLEKRRLADFDAEDVRFHDLFLSLSDNTLIGGILTPLRRRLSLLPQHPLSVEQAEARLGDHGRIVDSIRVGNRVAAVSILRHEHWLPARFLCPKPGKVPRLVHARRNAA